METTEDNLFGGKKVKDIRNGTTLFLLFVLISAFSAHGAPHFFQFINSSSQSSSTITDSIPLLQKNIPPQHRTPNTGIIPSQNVPRDSITEIVGGQDQFFPGSDIHIRNRFIWYLEANETHDIVIVSQVIYIFLFESSVDQQTMIFEGNRSDPRISTNYVHEATTNGSHDIDKSAFVYDPTLTPTVGFIDTTFQIPNSTKLAGMGIGSDDEVTVFQYYPANNETSKINTYIIKTDTFTLSSAATFSVDTEFIPNTIRQGEFTTARFSAMSGTTPIDNVSVNCTLHFADNDTEIPLLDSGFFYEFQDVSFPYNPSTITDTNGEIGLYVSTTYPDTPEDDYYFNITADFTGTEFYVANYEKVTYVAATFTVENVPDIVTDTSFAITGIIPNPVEPPNANSTIVTVRIQAVDTYGGTGLYPLANIPINATLDIQESWVNIGSGAVTNGTPGWYLSDSNGEVEFDITTGFPNPYQTKTPTITVRADLQSNLAPTYPLGEPHRFVYNNTGGKIVTEIDSFSIDPDFWVGNIGFLGSAASIRPGGSAILEYEVYNAGKPPFEGVPVNITLEDAIPGVSLFINGTVYVPYDIYGYYYTDSNGRIEVTVYTTYLVTPENIKNIALNITADFENDSNVRWIGNVNAIDRGAADTLANFDKTWRSVVRSNDLTINSLYNNCTISFFDTNETGDATIRPGDDITVRFVVRNQQGSPLSGVYVNVSLAGPLSYTDYSNAGVSLNNHISSGTQDPTRSGYYYTNPSGYIVVYITTMYGTTPKNLDIGLIATADFENDSYSPWYVGSKGIRSDFRSNSSYSETTKTITVDPQYFIGRIVVKGSPRTIVPQNGTLTIEFELRLQEYETGAWVIPPAILIDDVNVSILINGQKPADLNMEVTPAWQNSVDSSVIFIIKANSTSGTALEGDYTIDAEADYDSAKSFTYNFSHGTVPTGKLLGIWVNGSDPDGYSRASRDFKVQNRDIITVTITDVTDPSHPDAGFDSDSGLYEIYRTSTFITITGTYEDATQDPVPNEDIQIFMNHSLANGNYLVPVTTEIDGSFSVIINLPLLTPLEDGIVIYGLDPTPPTPQEVRIGDNNTRVVTTVDLSLDISGFNGDSVFVGESVSIQGQLTDNLGFSIDSNVNIFQDSFSELTGNLRLVGWNGTDEVGVPLVTSPSADGSFDLVRQIPNNYSIDIFFIRLNITSSGLIHYRMNYTQSPINVYWDFLIDNLEINIPSSGNTADLTNNSVYVIAGVENRDVTLRGTLTDSNGADLNFKDIRTSWNGTPSLSAVNNTGFFTFDYSFPGWESSTWIWEFQHILDNGTTLSKYYIITLKWEVVDETNPEIVIVSPDTSNGYILLLANDTMTINVTVIDPEAGVVSDGLDNSSVIIIINGINRSMIQDPFDGSLFSYDWNTTNVNDTSYRIMIIAEDLAKNSQFSEIEIIFDVVKPSAHIEVTENNEGYLVADPDGYVVISGSITDVGSITGNNTGINETSARLFIINPFGDDIKINTSISISENSFDYEWVVFLENLDLLSRDLNFSGTPNWKIRLTYSDIAGNINQTEKNVKLDNTAPNLNFVDSLPEEGEELLINITFDDQESGIYLDTLTLELLNATGSKLNAYTIRYGDSEMDETDTGITITLDVSELENGDYKVNIRVFDKTGNKNKGEVIESFTIYRPSPSNPLVNMIQLILAPILAFGGGIGIAALYERLKGIRSG